MSHSTALFSIAFLGGTLLLQTSAQAQQRADVQDLAHHPIEAAFDSGGQLELHIRSGDIRIVGTDRDKVTVHVAGSRGAESTDIHARFESFGQTGKLSVDGGPDNDVTITVEVPSKADLKLRVPAGTVEVSGITGSKDVDLHAGDLTIGVGSAADYYKVAASVLSGSIDAAPFGEDRGGLFRSFEKSGHGKYKLVAHVGAGNLKLN